MRATLLREARAKDLEAASRRVDAFTRQRRLKVRDDHGTKCRVRLRALHEVIEDRAQTGQLGCRVDPGPRGRLQQPEELAQALLVPGVLAHRSPDGPEASFLPSSCPRSFTKQREIRLAMVPEGRSTASPIVR